MRNLLILAALVAFPTMAKADPCEGRLPSRPGQTFSGTVRYVGDGNSLCVGNTADANEWIEVRMADFDAPELREPNGRRSRQILIDLSRGRSVICTAQRGRSGRVIANPPRDEGVLSHPVVERLFAGVREGLPGSRPDSPQRKSGLRGQ